MEPQDPPQAVRPPGGTRTGFRNGDLVQIDTADITALGRIREANGVKVHVALEVGEYLPWVDEVVMLRAAGASPLLARKAKMLHAGNSTCLLEMVVDELIPLAYRDAPVETLPFIDENW